MLRLFYFYYILGTCRRSPLYSSRLLQVKGKNVNLSAFPHQNSFLCRVYAVTFSISAASLVCLLSTD